MLIKEQLFTFCHKEYRAQKKPNIANYKQFLVDYYQHFVEEDHGVEDLHYFSRAAMSHYEQVMGYQKKALINVTSVNVTRQYAQTLTRVQMCFPDMPFMIESIRSLFYRLGCHIKHSNVMANYQVSLQQEQLVVTPVTEKGHTFVWFDIETEQSLGQLKKALQETMKDVECCVNDWHKMQDSMRQVMGLWRNTPTSIASMALIEQYVALMEWVLQSFAFLGYHGYQVNGKKRQLMKHRFGLAAKPNAIHYVVDEDFKQNFPNQVNEESFSLVLFTQTEDVSTVHRNTHKDLIVLRVYQPGSDELVEEHYFSGLLTADAYVSDPSKIPLIKQKFTEIVHAQSLRSRYALRRMEYIFKSFPREEILQNSIHRLSEVVYDIFMIQERPVIRSYIRRDFSRQYYSVLVYIPRQIMTTRLRLKMEAMLGEMLNAQHTSYTPFFAESLLTRLHFVLRCDADSEPNDSFDAIQNALVKLCELKEEKIVTQLCENLGQKSGYQLATLYSKALSDTYLSAFSATDIADDIVMFDALTANDPVKIRLTSVDKEGGVICRLYQCTKSRLISMMEVFPMLQNLGFVVKSEQYFEECIHDQQYHLSAYRCVIKPESVQHFLEVKATLEKDMVLMLQGKLATDRYSCLMINAALSANEVEVIRGICAYLKQIDFPLSQSRITQFFIDHPLFAQKVIRIFHVKFQPKLLKRDALLKRHQKEALKYAETVSSSDEERIIQSLLQVLAAIVRTNFYLSAREALVFKIASQKIMNVPKPAPLFEFFVFSPRLMGVHLRFGMTARGGIRNSDRYDDVRHEVFELAKTQRLKNTLIVPDGAKGGFVCHKVPSLAADLVADEVKACYEIFIRSMLSITDNVVDEEVTRHQHLVIYDGDDPYFVVAADKGTATFSPYANQISMEKGYWLGDAFASGGRFGYDHKKMGITAKGAWESVKWHFKAMGKSVYQEPFTVAAIGDMAGDVFGNGLLLSDRIQLVAAFNHAAIFIDPAPDCEVSYQERLRLFRLPRSRWQDYNVTKMSPGGGIFLRTDKFIELTPQMKKLFSTTKSRMEPNEMIREILKLPVGLLWNGGIGVYVKSGTESHMDVMDLQNDACRVNASSLKAQVVGEGGNNGFTQLARVEYAQHGGRINTDFIDNSAGVDTSDVEVNLKILFQPLVARKRLSMTKRNVLLSSVTQEVSKKVLHHNFLQNVLIDCALLESQKSPDQYIRMIDYLESTKLLNRDIEKIPSKKVLQHRSKLGSVLTRPEMAVLLSYSKIDLLSRLEQLDLNELSVTESFLLAYFPQDIATKYSRDIKKHLLRKELILTEMMNAMLSEVGILFVSRLCDECNTGLKEVVLSYLIVRESLKIKEVYEQLYHHCANLDQDTLLYLVVSIQRAIYKSCRWLIRYQDLKHPKKVLAYYDKLSENIGVIEYLPKKYVHRILKIKTDLQHVGMIDTKAELVSESRYFYQLFGLFTVSTMFNIPMKQVKPIYYQAAQLLKFHKLKDKLLHLPVQSRWEAIQKSTIDDDLGRMLELLTRAILSYAEKRQCAPAKALDLWIKDQHALYQEIRESLNEILESSSIDLAVFVIVLTRVHAVLDGC